MAIAGRVAIVPKGDYDKNASYKRLDCVKYLNVIYVAKKDVPIGTAITDESYWMKGVEGGGGGGSSVIDDTQSSTLTTYSSNKINEFISDVGNSISDINNSLGDKIDTTGDVSEAVVSTLDEIPNTRLIPSVGDKIKVMFAKTIKYFQDLKTIAFTGDYEDLLNKPSIPTVTNNLLATESGTAWDAVQGKAINDKIGSTDISAIGDGSVTGALSTLNSNKISRAKYVGSTTGSVIKTTYIVDKGLYLLIGIWSGSRGACVYMCDCYDTGMAYLLGGSDSLWTVTINSTTLKEIYITNTEETRYSKYFLVKLF